MKIMKSNVFTIFLPYENKYIKIVCIYDINLNKKIIFIIMTKLIKVGSDQLI